MLRIARQLASTCEPFTGWDTAEYELSASHDDVQICPCYGDCSAAPLADVRCRYQRGLGERYHCRGHLFPAIVKRSRRAFRLTRRFNDASQRCVHRTGFRVGDASTEPWLAGIRDIPGNRAWAAPGTGARGRSTGSPAPTQKYGLQQDFWYDGRRDVLAATRAALDYLQFLHDMFGDWELALAAYNWGENGVQRAVANNRAHHKATNYASLRMPKETRNYLPKLQAVKNIIANPKLLGLELETIPNRPYFAVVKTSGHIDVVKAAQLADMPVEEFRSLNPGYNRPVIIQAAARHIVVPIDNVDEFHANLERNGDPLVTWQTYTLKKGETLNKVASKFGTTGYRLREVNGFDGRKHIRPGQVLLVPFASEDDATNLNETYSSPDFQAWPQEYDTARTYRVRNGDTLQSVARKHQVTVARIKAINALKSNQLHAGQHLVLHDDVRPKRRSHHRHPQRISSY